MQIWQSYNKKLEESLVLNRKNAEDITRLKVQSFLASMKPLKIFAVLIGILWAVFVDALAVNLFFVASPFFLVSAILQSALTKLAIGVYLYQLILLHRTDISEPIAATQEKIARLQASTLWVARVLFLQLPLWATFNMRMAMFKNNNLLWLLTQTFIALLLAAAAVWLFVNIKHENRHKKWFRFIFSGQEWEPTIKSMELLDEIQTLKAETQASAPHRRD